MLGDCRRIGDYECGMKRFHAPQLRQRATFSSGLRRARRASSVVDTEASAEVLLMEHGLVPGCFVIHPGQPDWGIGQVQSVVGSKVTANFPEQGKVVINIAVVPLELAEGETVDW